MKKAAGQFVCLFFHLPFLSRKPRFGFRLLLRQESIPRETPPDWWFPCICQLSLMPGGDWNKHSVWVAFSIWLGVVDIKWIWCIVELFSNWQLWLEWEPRHRLKGDSPLSRSRWNNSSWASPAASTPCQPRVFSVALAGTVWPSVLEQRVSVVACHSVKTAHRSGKRMKRCSMSQLFIQRRNDIWVTWGHNTRYHPSEIACKRRSGKLMQISSCEHLICSATFPWLFCNPLGYW